MGMSVRVGDGDKFFLRCKILPFPFTAEIIG